MQTIILKGDQGNYRLMRRAWYGGSDRPDYTMLAPISDDEAYCLIDGGFIMAKDELCQHDRFNIHDMMKIEDVDGRDELVMTLPENADLNRKKIKIVELFHRPNSGTVWMQEFIASMIR